MKVVVTMIAMIACTVGANLLLKLGATRSGAEPDIVSLVNWQVLLGLATFGTAGLLYAVVLRWLPLNIAQSFAAAQFVAVIVASALVLSEPISFGQWIGISFIATGILVVGVTAP
jgi:undecaprenyl phosphate-alpha-L-ara4N flippase subunit ArnE